MASWYIGLGGSVQKKRQFVAIDFDHYGKESGFQDLTDHQRWAGEALALSR